MDNYTLPLNMKIKAIKNFNIVKESYDINTQIIPVATMKNKTRIYKPGPGAFDDINEQYLPKIKCPGIGENRRTPQSEKSVNTDNEPLEIEQDIPATPSTVKDDLETAKKDQEPKKKYERRPLIEDLGLTKKLGEKSE